MITRHLLLLQGLWPGRVASRSKMDLSATRTRYRHLGGLYGATATVSYNPGPVFATRFRLRRKLLVAARGGFVEVNGQRLAIEGWRVETARSRIVGLDGELLDVTSFSDA